MDELNRLSKEEFKAAKKTPVCVVLDDVRSILNVGSVFRTSDAFRIEAIHLCGLTPVPNREMRKTALGAENSVDWYFHDNTVKILKILKEKGYIIYALEQTHDSKTLSDFNIFQEEKAAVIFVNEVKGVSENALALCDYILEIPQIGTKHSLNISVSAGIALWEFFKAYKK